MQEGHHPSPQSGGPFSATVVPLNSVPSGIEMSAAGAAPARLMSSHGGRSVTGGGGNGGGGGGVEDRFKSITYKNAVHDQQGDEEDLMDQNDPDEVEFSMADARHGWSLFLFGPKSKIRESLALVSH